MLLVELSAMVKALLPGTLSRPPTPKEDRNKLHFPRIKRRRKKNEIKTVGWKSWYKNELQMELAVIKHAGLELRFATANKKFNAQKK